MRAARKAVELVEGEPWQESSIPLGIDSDGRPVSVLGDELRSHVVVTGPTGEGKTTTFVRLLDGLFWRWRVARLPGIVMDFKGDLADKYHRVLMPSGRPSIVGRPGEPNWAALVGLAGARPDICTPHH